MSDSSTSPSVSSPERTEDASGRTELGLLTPVSPPASNSDADRNAYHLDLKEYIGIGCLVVDFKPIGPPVSRSQPSFVGKTHELLQNYDIPDELSLHLTRLLNAKWIRLFSRKCTSTEKVIVRVYVLPQDVGRNRIDRSSKQNLISLEYMLPHIDASKTTWYGSYAGSQRSMFDIAATPEDSSLFYIFNKLPSPSPATALVKDKHTRAAMEDLLTVPLSIPGLKTKLYPYQARSAAMMLQRESSRELILDPRLEKRSTPSGDEFYYGPRDASFLRQPRLYEPTKGGILSETMGLGKTLICLAIILATKGHLPHVPPQYNMDRILPTRPQVGSLVQMAISNANRHTVPGLSYLHRLRDRTGDDFATCYDQLIKTPPTYTIPHVPYRWNRNTTILPPTTVTMCGGTIIVVPSNLVHQWELEVQRHVFSGPSGLKVCVMNDPRKELPKVSELVEYDVILFSRSRFERENKHGSDRQGRRTAQGATLVCRCPYIGSTRKRDCNCLQLDDLYSSPLKEIHFLRIIIDEGHGFSSKNSEAVRVATELVKAERRWIVSGTPARSRLFGVEVDVGSEAANKDRSPAADIEAADDIFAPDASGLRLEDTRFLRQMALQRRKPYKRDEEMKGAVQSIGTLATHFLKVNPWNAGLDPDGVKTEWDEHIFRHDQFHLKTYSAFSTSLSRTLESLVIKTRPEDVERDIVLPPLHYRIVYLEPSFYDKITANMFILFLTGNAVTSEREDRDYLFHKNSAKALKQLIANLRQSNFCWTGFTEKDVLGAIDHGERYLQKENTKCSLEDRQLLLECLEFARFVLACEGWKSLSRTHEIGLFIDQWPDSSISSWSLAMSDLPPMVGLTQLSQAQAYVNERLLETNPFEGLDVAGVVALTDALNGESEAEKKTASSSDEPVMKMGVPTSTLFTEPSAAKRHHQSSSSKSPTKKRKVSLDMTKNEEGEAGKPVEKPQRKRKRSDADKAIIPQDSPVRNASITGTTSAKLSYLLEQIIKFQRDEKILVFYDGNNTAYYIAQCLDILHIPYRIFTTKLPPEKRSTYIVEFDENPSIRVLLMDVRCGAEGLNVNKASRVFFINPCCRPNIEAQAIKRSHRIGQTKPVHVETLILKGTIEEAMFKRAEKMSESEHQQAKELHDDAKIASIIQNARNLPVNAEDEIGPRKVAPLSAPQQIFGRDGRGNDKIKDVQAELDAAASERKPKRRRTQTQKARTTIKAKDAKSAPVVPTGPVVQSVGSFVPPVSCDSMSAAGPSSSIFGGG